MAHMKRFAIITHLMCVNGEPLQYGDCLCTNLYTKVPGQGPSHWSCSAIWSNEGFFDSMCQFKKIVATRQSG